MNMKKNTKKIYIYEFILLIFVMLFKFLVIDHFFEYSQYVNIIFWGLLFILLVIIGGFPKDRNYSKRSSVNIVVIILMLYTIIIYILGLFTGFAKSIYSHDFISIIMNISPLIIGIILMELCRYLIFKKNPNIIQIIIFTVLMIFLEVFITIRTFDFDSVEKIFLVVSVIILPIIARQFLYSYITYNISFVPTLIFRIFFKVFPFIPTIVPDLGNYLTAVIGVLLPYLIYKQISKSVLYREKYNIYAKRYFRKFAISFVLILGVGLTILVSGVFKYQIIAVASDSMKPIYARGDAVIFYKEDMKKIKEGDILVFKNNDTLITHRIVSIEKNGNNYKFVTKGDNNDSVDKNNVNGDDVVGVVKYIVKYIGFPTVWFSEQ